MSDSGYEVNGTIDPYKVDMSQIVASLREMNWNARIRYWGHRDETYSYKKQLKNGPGGCWEISATKDQSVDIDALSWSDIAENGISLGIATVEIDLTEGGGFADVLLFNHNDDETVEEYKRSTSKEVYDVLEACKYHSSIVYSGEFDPAHGVWIADLCKDVATRFANLVGRAVCPYGQDGTAMYAMYSLIARESDLKPAALKKISKLLGIKAADVSTRSANEILKMLLERLPDRALCYDPECVDDPSIYASVLKDHLTQADLLKKAKSVSATFNDASSEVTIKFCFGKKNIEWTFVQNNDWVENEFYVGLATFVEQNTKGSLLYYEMDDQSSNSIFVEKEIGAYLCSEGVLKSWI